jgi:hypothetical protein
LVPASSLDNYVGISDVKRFGSAGENGTKGKLIDGEIAPI